MKEKTVSKKVLRITTCMIELLMIGMIIWTFTQPRIAYSFSVEDMDSVSAIKVSMPEEGWYVDNSMELEDTVFLRTPEIDLNKGSYKMIIHYQTAGGGTFVSLDAENPTYRLTAGRKNMPLDGSVSSKEYEFNLYEYEKSFFVSFQYNGNGFAWISDVELKQTWAMERVHAFYALLIIFLFELIWLGDRKGWWRRLFISESKCNSLVTACIIGIPIMLASLPCFFYYIINGFDLNFHMLRIEGISEALKSGQFPARIQTNWLKGYGYPVSVFYGDLLLYMPAVLRAIGMPLQNVYKVFVASVNILTGVIMYFSAKGITKSRMMAVLASYLYLLLPYRLSCLYIRAGVGEYCAMAFFPLVVFGLYRIYTVDNGAEERRYQWLLPAIGFTGIIGSHLLSTVFVGMFTVIFCLILFKKTFEKNRFLILLKVVCSTILLNAAYLIPLLDYMRYDYKVKDTAASARIQAQGAYVSQIFSLFPNGNRFSVSISDDLGYANEMVFALGAVAWLGIVAFFIYFIFSTRRKLVDNNDLAWKGEKKAVYLFLGMGIITMALSSTWFPWDEITARLGFVKTIFNSIEFPWRYLSLASVFLILGSILALNSDAIKNESIISSGLTVTFPQLIYIVTIVLTISSASYLISTIISDNNSTFIVSNCDLSDSQLQGDEYIPVGVDVAALLSSNEPVAVNAILGDADVTGKQYIVSIASVGKEGHISIPRIYYHGYRAKLNETGEWTRCYADEMGRVCCDVPEGYIGKISVSFYEPWYWRVSELLSLIVVLFFGTLWIKDKIGIGVKFDFLKG